MVNCIPRYVENSISKPLLFFTSCVISVALNIASEKFLMLNNDESILQRFNKAS